jgi:enoyl-CoA hydratase/carnithine racemase
LAFEYLTYAVDDFIATVTINRPPVNALNARLVDELSNVCEVVAQDVAGGSVRVFILLAEGNVFCAGADLKERSGVPESQVITAVRRIAAMTDRIAKLAIPTIAALQGIAAGGGFEIALACDFRVASSDSKVGLRETALGIIPGAGGTQRLSRLIGQSQALLWITTARLFPAPEAKEFGAVNLVTEQNDLRAETYRLANEIAANGPLAVQKAKQAVSDGTGLSLDDALNAEMAAYETLVATEDRREGLQAFLQKRRPRFIGR